MKPFLIGIIFLAYSQLGFSQKNNCQIFKTGYFQNIDNNGKITLIKRSENFQFETDKSTGEKVKLKITWINECSYKLSIIKGNSKWKKENHVDKYPDLIVNIIETGEDYYIQVAKFEGISDFGYTSKIIIVDKKD